MSWRGPPPTNRARSAPRTARGPGKVALGRNLSRPGVLARSHRNRRYTKGLLPGAPARPGRGRLQGVQGPAG
jgi:hypothetical protein